MEVYVDDILVKSVQETKHISNLAETFETLRRYGMELNPSKCTFGVSSRKFLGFVVSRRGMEANFEKVQAVLDMQATWKIKQLEQLCPKQVYFTVNE
jgi:hypothetical protein